MLPLAPPLVAGPLQLSPHPALPELSLQALPPAVRAELQAVYARAMKDPGDAGAVGRLGMMLHAYDQHQSALSCYRLAHSLEPNALAWVYLAGLEEAATGDHARAARSLRAALELDPAYVPARIRLAEALVAAGDPASSLAEYTSLVRDVPDLAVAHYGLGRLSALRRDTKAAIEHYRRAVEIAPQFGGAHYALALAYRDTGLQELSEKHAAAFRRWGPRRPVPPDPILESVASLKNTGRSLLVTAAKLASEGRIQETVDLQLRALAADPAIAQAHVNLISLFGRLGQTAEAESHYRAALTLGSGTADAHYNYGVLLASSGRLRDAIETFRKALEVNPFHAQAHNNLATLLAASGQVDEAVSHYREAIANDPMHRSARFLLVLALLNLGRVPDAASELQQLPRSEGDDRAHLWFRLAKAWLTVNDASKARGCAEEALRQAKAAGQTELAGEIARTLVTVRAAR
jgi:tetratricopeptide (TPR) repeat protein